MIFVKKKRASPINDQLIKERRNYIVNSIREGKKDLKKIIEALPLEKEKEILDIIRAILDTKEIYYESPGRLQVSQSSKLFIALEPDNK